MQRGGLLGERARAASKLTVQIAMGRADPLGTPAWALPLTPMAGFVFLGLSLWIWGFGVRRYTSTGS